MERIEGHPCPTCGKGRTYKNPLGAKRSKGRDCVSCSNSKKAGGEGMASTLCIDCKERERHYTSLCKVCHNKRAAKYHKDVYSWKKYGLSHKIPKTSCELCNSEEELVYDHCHTSGLFRGVLCRKCNTALGLFKDDEGVLNKAIKYLRRADVHREQ